MSLALFLAWYVLLCLLASLASMIGVWLAVRLIEGLESKTGRDKIQATFAKMRAQVQTFHNEHRIFTRAA